MTATTRPASSRSMWAILALVLLADALDVIDATVTTIAAPTIAEELHGGPGLIKWLATAYMLAMGALLVVGGRLGDRYGQRRLFLIGMTGFTVASAVAGLSPDPASLSPWPSPSPAQRPVCASDTPASHTPPSSTSAAATTPPATAHHARPGLVHTQSPCQQLDRRSHREQVLHEEVRCTQRISM
ncbi:MFS transporter [Actinomadura kijaniata]|uniref:MFS transporter n=1 Tax=Actinomadura kijaniata TaxID=46161 RepID=UPI003F1D8061